MLYQLSYTRIRKNGSEYTPFCPFFQINRVIFLKKIDKTAAKHYLITITATLKDYFPECTI